MSTGNDDDAAPAAAAAAPAAAAPENDAGSVNSKQGSVQSKQGSVSGEAAPAAGGAPAAPAEASGGDAPAAPSAEDAESLSESIAEAAERRAQVVVQDVDRRAFNLKFANATFCALTAAIVLGVVLFGVREEGVFGDPYLWMGYQSLLTPPTYVYYAWIPLFLFQGLFVYASALHPELKESPLAGYGAYLADDAKRSVAAHYPGICICTLTGVYAHDHGHMPLAFLATSLGLAFAGSVLKIQDEVRPQPQDPMLADVDDAEGGGSANRDPFDSGCHAIRVPIETKVLEYLGLRLPFELYGGYALGLAATYLDATLDWAGFLPSFVKLIAANLLLVGLAAAAYGALWKAPNGTKFYGVPASLAWYLLGVTAELHTPTQPVYNAYSSPSILFTQVVAGIAAAAVAAMLVVRWGVPEKLGMPGCKKKVAEGGTTNESEMVGRVSEGEVGGIGTDYVNVSEEGGTGTAAVAGPSGSEVV